MSCLLPPPGVGAPVRTAPALAKLRFRGRPLWKTAPRRKQSPSIHSAFVKQVFPPLVFGSSLISEHEGSDPRPRPTQRYSGSTERNGPPPPLNRLFSSPRSCRVRRTRCWGQPPQCSRCSHPATTLKRDEPEIRISKQARRTRIQNEAWTGDSGLVICILDLFRIARTTRGNRHPPAAELSRFGFRVSGAPPCQQTNQKEAPARRRERKSEITRRGLRANLLLP
jgi:hypothetical protein